VLLLGILVLGLFSGWVASWILGDGAFSRQDWGELLVVGLVGSFVGGMVLSLLFGDGLSLRPSGIIGSILGAVIVLLVWRRVKASRS
jgi:uncharacterized membrane protein YeaQ/YmgE (transglycosylase-associated protein family)